MAKKQQADAGVKARVLLDCTYGKADAVVTLTAEQALAGTAAGELDTDPRAVAHAEQLTKQHVDRGE
jgi:hypothetical protein